MQGVFRFLASNVGRWVRIIAGVVLILGGSWLIEGIWSWILIIVGFIPFVAGVFDWCFFAPIFGFPFNGEQLRKVVGVQKR
ncbi:MAG: DUF2892 domain-containing protein [Anaerolineales bacterium]|jgi:hypothetical protein